MEKTKALGGQCSVAGLTGGGIRGKEPTCQCRRRKRGGFGPWAGKIPWRRAGHKPQCSCLENPMDRGAWWATGHGVTELDTTEAGIV